MSCKGGDRTVCPINTGALAHAAQNRRHHWRAGQCPAGCKRTAWWRAQVKRQPCSQGRASSWQKAVYVFWHPCRVNLTLETQLHGSPLTHIYLPKLSQPVGESLLLFPGSLLEKRCMAALNSRARCLLLAVASTSGCQHLWTKPEPVSPTTQPFFLPFFSFSPSLPTLQCFLVAFIWDNFFNTVKQVCPS